MNWVRGLGTHPQNILKIALRLSLGAVGVLLSFNSFAQSFVVGSQVASVAVESAQPGSTFLLQFSLPLPENIYPSTSGLLSFGVRDPLTQVVRSAQVERISHYPSGHADIVYLSVRLNMTPSPHSSGLHFLRVYSITYNSAADRLNDEQTYETHPDVHRLMVEEAIKIRITDALGDVYEAPISSPGQFLPESVVRGKYTHQLHSYAVSTPVSEPAPLPHHLGVKAYFQFYSGRRYLNLHLRLDNAQAGFDADRKGTPLGKIYFQKVELWVKDTFRYRPRFEQPQGDSVGRLGPTGWRIYDLFRPQDDGSSYVIQQGRTLRVYGSVYQPAQEPEAVGVLMMKGQGFARPGRIGQNLFYSFYNRETSRYFVQAETLPLLYALDFEDLRNETASTWSNLQSEYLAGTHPTWPNGSPLNFPFIFDRMGAFHIWGVADGSLPGGTEIGQTWGTRCLWSADYQCLLYWQLRSQMRLERQEFIFSANGSVPEPDDWIRSNGVFDREPYEAEARYAPWEHTGVSVIRSSQGPKWQISDLTGELFDGYRALVGSMGLVPSYEDQLLGIQAIDTAHLVRAWGPAAIMVYLANDPVTKDDIREMAQVFRYSGRFNIYRNSSYGFALGYGLFARLRQVLDNPGTGIQMGREDAWGYPLLAMRSAFDHDEFRQKMFERIRLYTLFVYERARVSGCADQGTGNFLSHEDSHMLQGQYRASPKNEEVFVLLGLRSFEKRLYQNVDEDSVRRIQGLVAGAARSSFEDWGWDPVNHGVYFRTAVSTLDRSQMFCSSSELPAVNGFSTDINGQPQHVSEIWTELASALEVTGQSLYWLRTLEMLGDYSGLFQFHHGFDQFDRLDNRSSHFSLMQKISCGGEVGRYDVPDNVAARLAAAGFECDLDQSASH